MPKSIINYDSLIESNGVPYYLVYIHNNYDGNVFPALFTQKDIMNALLLGQKHPEYAPKVKNTWLMKFLRGIGVCE